jgi:dolichyl-phosphate beta-glucosyltransferase
MMGVGMEGITNGRLRTWSESAIALSIVVPAFNEEQRIGATLDSIETFLSTQSGLTEVIVVDDGSIDATGGVVAASTCPNVRVVRCDRNMGKGYAVRVGMLAASGEQRLFMDADESTPIRELDRLQRELDAIGGSGVAFGSIAVPGAEVLRSQSGLRRAAGRLGNRAIRVIALRGVRDSQRGFKLFSADAADAIFSRCVVNGWGFDVEVLAVAGRLGFGIVEVPVSWAHMEDSRVTPLSYIETFAEVLGVRWRIERGAYDLTAATLGHIPSVDAKQPTASGRLALVVGANHPSDSRGQWRTQKWMKPGHARARSVPDRQGPM